MAFVGLNMNNVVPGDSENNSETNLPANSKHSQNKPSENTNLPRTQTITFSDYKQNTRPLLNTNRTQSISQDAQQKYSENTDCQQKCKEHRPSMNTNRTQTICEHKYKRPPEKRELAEMF